MARMAWCGGVGKREEKNGGGGCQCLDGSVGWVVVAVTEGEPYLDVGVCVWVSGTHFLRASDKDIPKDGPPPVLWGRGRGSVSGERETLGEGQTERTRRANPAVPRWEDLSTRARRCLPLSQTSMRLQPILVSSDGTASQSSRVESSRVQRGEVRIRTRR